MSLKSSPEKLSPLPVDLALQPRKRPTQKRSIASYERILSSAYDILRAGDESALTTNSVAARAGISVGSLYEYFPSKEAIVAALFERKLAHVRHSTPPPEHWDPVRIGWRDWVQELATTMKRAEQTQEIDFASLNTVMTSEGLKRLDRAHAEWIADQFVMGMKRFGSTWPDDALFDLGINIYSLDACTWFYWKMLGGYSDLAFSRAILAMLAMMEPAMSGEPAPAGPFVRREFSGSHLANGLPKSSKS